MSTVHSQGSSSFSMNANEDKYHGVLITPKSTLFKKSLFDFVSYITELAPNNPKYSSFFYAWFLFIWVLNSFSIPYAVLFPKKATLTNLVGYLDVFARVIPPHISIDHFFIFSIVIFVILFVFLVQFFVCSFYFNKKGKLPLKLSTFNVYFLDGPAILLILFYFANAGDHLETWVSKPIKNDLPSFIFFILMIVVSLILLSIIFIIRNSQLSFRAISFNTFYPLQANIFILVQIIISFFTSAVCSSNKEFMNVFFFVIGILCYLVMIYFSFFFPCFINMYHTATCYSTSFGSILISIFSIFHSVQRRAISQSVFIVEVLVQVIIIVISIPLERYRRNKALRKLDIIQDNPSSFETLCRTQQSALLLATVGFEFTHPLVLSWDYMKLCQEKWPNSRKLIWIWARFIAAFPDENSNLQIILETYKTVTQNTRNPISSITDSYFKHQIKLLMRERQDAMTTGFKRQIEKVNSLSSNARNKERRFWECVIQGNITDMESSSYAAKKAITEAEVEVTHLLREYQNNQHVARTAAKYLLKVKGDKVGYGVWQQNYLKLKNGMKIMEDRAEAYAQESFPLLSTIVRDQQSSLQETHDIKTAESSLFSQASNQSAFEGGGGDDSGMFSSIKESIDAVSLPAVKTSIILTSLAMVFCVAFILFELIYPILSAKKTSKLVQYAGDAAMLNIQTQHLCLAPVQDAILMVFGANSGQHFSVHTQIPEIRDAHEVAEDAFGTSPDSPGQIAYANQILNSYILSLREIFNYKSPENSYVKKAQNLLFSATVESSTITNKDYASNEVSVTTSLKSIQAAATYVGILANEVAKLTNALEVKMYIGLPGKTGVPTMINHSRSVHLAIKQVVNYLVKEVQDEFNSVDKVQRYSLFGGGALGVILILLMAFISFSKLRSQQELVSKSFLTIPKHAVSSIVESFKISDRKDTDEDMTSVSSTDTTRNKQEENNLALLNSTSESSLASSLPLRMILVFACISSLIYIGCLVYQYFNLKEACNMIKYAAPHASNVPLAYSAAFSCIVTVFRLACCIYSNLAKGFRANMPGDEKPFLIDQVWDEFLEFQQDILVLRMGDEKLNLGPIVSLDSKIQNDYHNPTCEITTDSFKDKHSFYKCFSPDMQLAQLESRIAGLVGHIHTEGAINIFDGEYIHGYHMLVFHLYKDFVVPFVEYITTHAFDFFETRVSQVIGLSIMFVILMVISLLFEFYGITNIQTKVKSMLELLLHCPPDAILSTKPLVKVLGGDFSDKQSKTIGHNNEFYENIVEKFVDCVFITTPDLVCIRYNPATERFFQKNVTNMKLTDLLPEESDEFLEKYHISVNQQNTSNQTGNKGKKPVKGNKNKNNDHQKKENDNEIGSMREFIRQYDQAKVGEIPIKISQDIQIEREEGTVYLNISLQAMGAKGLLTHVDSPSEIQTLVIVARNITQSVLSKKLLKEEREKSDQLLRHILPPMIAEGLQRGETEISFTVPSASILFLDIVEFTPWCASLQATQVMSTLNIIFIELDALLAQYETLTKIKCIGDCYMAAGGIFEGPNGFCPPSQHASEMIKFGIDAIHAIEKVNGEIGQHLRIRVGINSGGPIVAGVLGVDRPTFEIFGPAINMAQQMEHHGVPMAVHVSKNVYDLVYAEKFNIKERGQIEVKQGMVTTYVVTP